MSEDDFIVRILLLHLRVASGIIRGVWGISSSNRFLTYRSQHRKRPASPRV